MVISTIEVMDRPLKKTETLSALEKALRGIGIEGASAFSTKLFSFDKEVGSEALNAISALVSHNVTQKVFANAPLKSDSGWDFAIKVDYKPGVTDNDARVLASDIKLAGIDAGIPYTSNIHYIKGMLDESLVEQLERISSNPQIHDITILRKNEFDEKGGFENKIHPVNLGSRPNFFTIDLDEMAHSELLRTGAKGTLNLDYAKEGMTEKQKDKLRGGTLSLEEDYMLKIQEYSRSGLNTQLGRKKGVLTDTELEVLGQMWSEHCRHSLYNAEIPESKEGIFKEYIKTPSLKVLEKKPHLGISIYKDNGGVFKFNDKWNVVIKNETHNSPSALDPFGGSMTGIVGVNRDPQGTGLGAEVIGNFLFYFLGNLNDKRKYFKSKSDEGTLESLLLNPEQIYTGVVKGVEEGGNQMGIPLNLGMCQHHENYNGKPIVGVGCFGRMPPEILGNPSHEKHIDIGDRLYIVGGRAGKDGIHGATFSSEELSANSPATAVQIGDPYTQRKMFEALLELRDKGYIKFVTDLGAGGTSCAAFEMAEETGGIEIDLDRLLIKYEGMTATELLLNESQERMAIAVDQEHKAEIEEILRKHEVEFSDIGVFTDSGRAIVHCKGDEVVNLDMGFVHKGFPKRKLNPAEYRISEELAKKLNALLFKEMHAAQDRPFLEYLRNEFYNMLRRPNLSSIADITDKMDSTVKGLCVQHCIQGKGRVSTKTSCTLVDFESKEGLIMSYGHSERQSYIDAEKMGKNAFLRSIGNAVAMGGRLDHMVATDQALWQSSNTPKYQQMLIEANRGMASVIEGCEIPVISGKDSMYNQATVYDEKGNVVKRGVYPTILMTTAAKIDNVEDIVTVDAKQEGDIVYLVGSKSKSDIGGSEFTNMYAEKMGIELPIGDVSNESIAEVYNTFKRMNDAAGKKILQSAKYVEEGGLVHAINQAAMAGEIGIEFDIEKLDNECCDMVDLMYGETEGRFLVTVKKEHSQEFENLFEGKFSRIGEVKGDSFSMKYGKETLLSENILNMLKVYHGAKQ